MKKVTYEQMLEQFLDGKEFILDEIPGKISVEGIYPYRKIMHWPNKDGKEHPKYLEMKRTLKDDWGTDLTHSERLSEIMIALGVVFNDDGIFIPEDDK